MKSYQEDCGTITIKTLFTRLLEKGKFVATKSERTLLNIETILMTKRYHIYFSFFRYVYRFVCDLHGLLGYTAQEIHAMVDLQPLSATAGTAATANVTNNNNENHVNHSNHSHDDNPGSLAPSETPSSLMGGHHSIKIEQIPKTPRHMYE